MSSNLLVLFLALLLDRIVGDPDALWRKVPHPVVIFGKAISLAEKMLNDPAMAPAARKRNGVLALVLLLLASLATGAVIHLALMSLGWLGLLLEAVLASVFLAQKSLGDHVLAVATGLRRDGLAGGRRAVSMIVGRDPDMLDEAGICRAALESLAENFSDGVVAPAFWFALMGLPGLLAYKMLNTADSMIGHKSERYLHFGWAAARTDDWANWIPARFSVLFIAAGSLLQSGWPTARRAIGTALRDARLHRSPNSGWPEGALAGALGIQLAGPRVYGGVLVQEPMINGAGRQAVGVTDVEQGVTVFYRSGTALAAFTLVLGFLCLAAG